MWIFISSYLQSFINHSPNSPKMFFLLFRPKIKFDLLIGLKECSELSSNSQMRREDPFSVTKPMIVCVLDINFFSSVFTQKSRNDQQLSYRHTISSESYSVQLLSWSDRYQTHVVNREWSVSELTDLVDRRLSSTDPNPVTAFISSKLILM